MRSPCRVLGLLVVFCLAATSVALACHSNYFDELFTKLDKRSLTNDQLKALTAVHQQYVQDDHSKGQCANHDSHKPQFVAAAAGILNSEQFKTYAGREKTEVEQLRFDVNELKKEVAEIKALLAQLAAEKSK
ncbi:MAG: hypothetical protein L0Z55_03680 [Planctomycetes bacterium]|nr:hypothetical protein [Planctomycetota bacterium]